METQQIHALLVTEGARLSLPEAYQRDLHVHDLNQLEESGTQEFIWVLRTCGTHIFELDTFKDMAGNRPSDLMSCMKQTFSDNVRHFYHYKAGALREVTYEQGCTIATEAVFRLHEKQRLQRRAAAMTAAADLL